MDRRRIPSHHWEQFVRTRCMTSMTFTASTLRFWVSKDRVWNLPGLLMSCLSCGSEAYVWPGP